MSISDFGRLIVVEGIDGSGKTTLVSNLEKRLTANGYKVCNLNTDEDIKKLRYAKTLFKDIIGGDKKDMYVNDLQVSLLALADLYNIKNTIEQKIRDGYIILADRYYYSTLVYGCTDVIKDYIEEHGYGPFTGIKAYYKRMKIYKRIIKDLDAYPDFVLFLDIDPKLAYDKVKSRSDSLDIYENETMLMVYRDIYKSILQERCLVVAGYTGGAWLSINNDDDYKTLEDNAYEKIIQHIKETK